MTIYATVKCWHRKYFQGFVMKDERKIQVLLPYAEELVPKSEAEKKRKVKFDCVLKGVHIIVKLA